MKKRCLAQLSLAGSWGTVHLWPGLEVDVDRELEPGFTVADAVVGREDCFEPIEELQDDELVAVVPPEEQR